MSAVGTEAWLLAGEDYKESLRDDREVWYDGEKIDVTTHPATAGGVERLADLYDAQHDPELQDLLTHVTDDGRRFSTSWLVPRSKEDLKKRRKHAEWVAEKTLGVFGRQLGNMASTVLGLMAYEPTISDADPKHGENIYSYVEYARKNNVILAGAFAEPQGADRRTGEARDEVDGESPLPPSLRIVDENRDGIWISGAKSAGTLAPQAHEILTTTFAHEDPEGNLACVVPVDADGVQLVCRESDARPNSSAWSHPVSGPGTEIDALVIYDEVFVPHDRVFSSHSPVVKETDNIGVKQRFSTLTRMCVKAELLAGCVQLVVNDLGLNEISGVTGRVADVMEHAQTLRVYVTAAEEGAEKTEAGLTLPDPTMTTAGQMYGVKHHSEVLQTVSELAGQGPIMRFHEDDYETEDIGPKLDSLLRGCTLSAKDKNHLMNLVWDLTQDPIMRRVDAFERLNRGPLFKMKNDVYDQYDLTDAMERLVDYLDLPKSEGLLANADGADL